MRGNKMSRKCNGTRIRIRWRRENENLKDLPYKVLAMTAEGWLFEETRHETVILDHVDILFLQGSFSPSNFLSECGVCIAGPEGILARVVCFLIVRHRALHLSIFLQTDRDEIPILRFYPSVDSSPVSRKMHARIRIDPWQRGKASDVRASQSRCARKRSETKRETRGKGEGKERKEIGKRKIRLSRVCRNTLKTTCRF